MAHCGASHNGDNNGTWLNSELLQHLFVHHKWSHVDFSKFRTGVGGKDVPQEEIVNDVLRSCVFEAFEAHLPESLGTASYELGGRDFQSFFAAVDSDGNGAIDFREFLHLSRSVVGIRPSQVSNQQLRRIFYTLDKDASGELSIQEFLDWFNDKSAGEGSDARKVFESVASSAASGLKRCQVFGSGENLMREAAVVECTDQVRSEAGATQYCWLCGLTFCWCLCLCLYLCVLGDALCRVLLAQKIWCHLMFRGLTQRYSVGKEK